MRWFQRICHGALPSKGQRMTLVRGQLGLTRNIITMPDFSPHDEQSLDDPEDGTEIQYIYGSNSVYAALLARKRNFTRLYTHGEANGRSNIVALARKLNIDIEETDNKGVLNNLSNNRPHNGHILECSALQETLCTSLGTSAQNWCPILENRDAMQIEQRLAQVEVELSRNPLYILLDELTDPQNIGSIMRTAYFMGATGVILSMRNCAKVSAVVAKASAGACEFLPIFYTSSTVSFIKMSQKNGWQCVATVGRQDAMGSKEVPMKRLAALHATHPLVLVLGSEGPGLRTLVKRECARCTTIPSGPHVHPAVDSLNVGVAIGSLLTAILPR